MARFITFCPGMPEDKREEYLARQSGGYKALAIMEQQLYQSDFLTGAKVMTADISLCAYTHVAYQGSFALDNYSAIQLWLNQTEALPVHTLMTIRSES